MATDSDLVKRSGFTKPELRLWHGHSMREVAVLRSGAWPLNDLVKSSTQSDLRPGHGHSMIW